MENDFEAVDDDGDEDESKINEWHMRQMMGDREYENMVDGFDEEFDTDDEDETEFNEFHMRRTIPWPDNSMCSG